MNVGFPPLAQRRLVALYALKPSVFQFTGIFRSPFTPSLDLPIWEASSPLSASTESADDVTAFDALAKALKATMLVVLLSLAWAMPAKAHLGHGSTSRAIAQASMSAPQAAQRAPAVASPTLETASVCSATRPGVSVPLGSPEREGTLGRACCGTMCTVALIELGVAPPPARTPHGIRLALPPETPFLARAPGLPARPPRTPDIA